MELTQASANMSWLSRDLLVVEAPWLADANVTLLVEEGMGYPTTAPTMEYEDKWAENKWMLVTPRVTAVISLLGIVCVALEAWKDLQADKRRSVVRSSRIRSSTTTRQNVSIISRIQVFYQIPLFLYTMALALGTLPVPQGQAWGAYGNIATCSLQGWMLQFGLHGILAWDAVLSTTYLMMVRYKVGNLQLRSYEKYYHMVIWTVACVVSIIPLVQDMYNFNNTICWLESYPDNCEGDECLRGKGVVPWQDAASYLGILHLVYSMGVMISLYCSIRGLENTKERLIAAGSSQMPSTLSGSRSVQNSSVAASTTSNRRKHSRAVGIQGMLYCSGMIFTVLPTALYILLWNALGVWNDAFGIFATALVPLVGYVNFLVYMRGRTAENCHTQYAKILRRAHSCIFDYELRCECHCLPRRIQGLGTGRTTVPRATQRQVNPVTDAGNAQRQSSTVPLDQTNGKSSNPASHLNVVYEEGEGSHPNVACDEGADTVSSLKNGPFTGFFIKVKSKGKRFSQWVSELGASGISEEESDSEDCSSRFEDDCFVDKRPPSKPMRVLSDAFLGSEIDGNGYRDGQPMRPERLESTLDTSFEHQAANNNPSCGRSKSTEPPALPERYTSEVETILDNSSARIPPSRPEVASNSNIDNSFARRAPRMPERYASEIETTFDLGNSSSHHGHSSRRALPVATISGVPFPGAAPPIKPQRLESEVEQLDREGNIHLEASLHRPLTMQRGVAGGPPILPQRLVSEADEVSDSELETSFTLHDLDLSATPVIPERSEVHWSATNQTTGAPPTKPRRYTSECENSESDGLSIGNGPDSVVARYFPKADGKATHPDHACRAPPSCPVRLVSEAEMGNSNSSFRRRASQTSDSHHSTSLNGSYSQFNESLSSLTSGKHEASTPSTPSIKRNKTK